MFIYQFDLQIRSMIMLTKCERTQFSTNYLLIINRQILLESPNLTISQADLGFKYFNSGLIWIGYVIYLSKPRLSKRLWTWIYDDFIHSKYCVTLGTYWYKKEVYTSYLQGHLPITTNSNFSWTNWRVACPLWANPSRLPCCSIELMIGVTVLEIEQRQIISIRHIIISYSIFCMIV